MAALVAAPTLDFLRFLGRSGLHFHHQDYLNGRQPLLLLPNLITKKIKVAELVPTQPPVPAIVRGGWRSSAALSTRYNHSFSSPLGSRPVVELDVTMVF